MIEVDGKQVFTELREVVKPEHTALLVVDMQRDFCTEEGSFGQAGVDLSMYPAAIERIRELVDAARAAGVLVVFIQMTTLPGGRTDSPAQIRFNMRMHSDHHGGYQPLRYTLDGSEGQQFVPGLEPADGDVVVKKYRSSSFWGTNLDLILRSNGIESLVVTGCTTEGCVESTARDAMFNDYYVVVAGDAVASDDRAQHEASMYLMTRRFEVASNEQLERTWAAHAS